MLYEVITHRGEKRAANGTPPPKTANLLLADTEFLDQCPVFVHVFFLQILQQMTRITSYNVCYTKLLRCRPAAPAARRSPRGSARAPAPGEVLLQIEGRRALEGRGGGLDRFQPADFEHADVGPGSYNFV